MEITALRLVSLESVKPCSPRSNIDLIHCVCSTFDYYCKNYAISVLLSHTSGNKIVYARHYKAEIGGEISRFCGMRTCIRKNPRMYYDFDCKKPENCMCVLCCKQPRSIKSANSEIVFGLYNKHKFLFDNFLTCKQFEIPDISEEFLLHILLS